MNGVLEHVRTGRFQRSLALVTAAGSLVTGAEIFLEHDQAGFGNRVMWWPVLLGPVGAAAGVAGACSERAARTALPLASAAITANGVQGTYLHLRGILDKPGGWRMTRFNVETGPPVFAPLLMSMVGGLGLLAAALRREDAPADPRHRNAGPARVGPGRRQPAAGLPTARRRAFHPA